MKYLVKFCVFFILGSIQGQAQGLFNQAAQNYKNEAYNKAIEQWNTILDNGQHSAALYYNMGNAHYKLNQVGPSIYYYEKAIALTPNDPQIKTNLAFAQNAKIDAVTPLPKTFFSRWYTLVVGQFTFDQWALLAVLFSVLFSILFLRYYFASAEQKKRLFFTTAIICGCLFVLAFAMASVSYQGLQKNVFAIVFSEATDIKSAPKNNSDTVFVIHEGTKVQLLETDGLWSHVAIVNGIEGWMPSSELKKL
jgi:tetratricopeptide (TPR) repeat protein